MLLILVSLILSAAQAHAANVILKPIKTEYGIKLYLEGLESDYKLTYSDGLLTISFEEPVDFLDIALLKKASKHISRVVTQPQNLNIFFDKKDITVDKFTDSKKRGINIFIETPKSDKKGSEESQPIKKIIPKIDISQEQTASGVRIVFNWPSDVSAAAFERSGKLWVVFDNAADFQIDKNVTLASFKQEKVLTDSGIISMDYDPSTSGFGNVMMYKEGNKWIAEFSDKSVKPKEIRVMSRPYAAPRPRVELEFDSTANPAIRFKDPYIGDEIAVIPSSDSATGITTNYGFVDFKISKSFQGALIQVVTDSILIQDRAKSIYIEGAATLNIAPRVNRKSEKKFEGSEFGFKLDKFVEDYQSILSLKSYEVPKEGFVERLAELRNVLSTAESVENRSKVLANWSLFYLANGFYIEGLTIIKMIKQENPEFAGTYNIQTIEMALNFMNHDYLAAYKIARALDIASVPISLRKEVRFWQAITGYMVSDSSEYFNYIDPTSLYLDNSNSFLSEYTDNFLLEFGLSIATSKISDKHPSDAKQVIDRLTDMQLTGHNANRLHIISADYYAAKDDQEKAITELDSCISDLDDQLNRAICRYKKATLQYSTQRIPPKEYTKELEQIALTWRGDDLEVKVLRDLGETYYGEKDYLNALRSWKKIVEYFPYSPDALMLSRKIGETFVSFFTKGKDEGISHLQAASMFYEFEDLVPIGEVGDDVVIRFADHLIALDLLDKASALLNHQVTHRLKGNKREEAINKLAKVYVMNQEPALAVDVINMGDLYEELPDYIAVERKYIHAQALVDNEEDEKALALLAGDFSVDADEIKSQIYWRTQNWKEFNKFIEPRVYQIRDSKDEISTRDSDKVLKLCISYLILDEKQLLRDLLKDFRTRLPQKNLKADLMRMLTQTWESVNDNSVEALKDTTAIENQVKQLITLLNTVEQPATTTPTEAAPAPAKP